MAISVFENSINNPTSLERIVPEDQSIFETLGYRDLTSESSEELDQLIGEHNRKIVIAIEQDMLDLRAVEHEDRLEIDPPSFRILEKNGEKFYSIEFASGEIIIVRPQVTSTVTDIFSIGIKDDVRLFEVESFLVPGDDGSYLDFVSLRRSKSELRYLVTFTDIASGFSPTRVFGSSEYPNDILLSLYPSSGGFDNMRWFRYLWMHESAHSDIDLYERSEDTPKYSERQRERNANATVQLYAKEMNRLSKQTQYVDTIELSEWIDTQLETGYGLNIPDNLEEIDTDKLREMLNNRVERDKRAKIIAELVRRASS